MVHANTRGPRGHSRPPEVAPTDPRAYTRAALACAALVGIALIAMVLGPHTIGDCFTESDFYGSYARGARLIQQGRLDPTRYGGGAPAAAAPPAPLGRRP